MKHETNECSKEHKHTCGVGRPQRCLGREKGGAAHKGAGARGRWGTRATRRVHEGRTWEERALPAENPMKWVKYSVQACRERGVSLKPQIRHVIIITTVILVRSFVVLKRTKL